MEFRLFGDQTRTITSPLNRLQGVGTVLVLLATTVCAPVARATNMPWIPLSDWGYWNYKFSSSWVDSTGASGSQGPFIKTIQYLPVDYMIKDHHADYAQPDPGGVLPKDGNHYLMEDPATGDLFTLSDGNPNKGHWFEYYDDPTPFMTHELFEVGESKVYSGLWSGQWGDHAGGFQPWTGEWTTTYTNLGLDLITTPLGTFDAIKWEIIDTDTKSPYLSRVDTSVVTANLWVAAVGGHMAPLQLTEHWRNDTYINGSLDHWSEENNLTQAVSAVPVLSAFWFLASGLLGLIGAAGRRSRV